MTTTEQDAELDRNALTTLHNHLRALRGWAEDRLEESHDPQDIAEYMTAVLDALLAHQTPPPHSL